MKTTRASRLAIKGLALGFLLASSLSIMAHADYVVHDDHEDHGAIGDRVFSIGPRATYVKPQDANKGKWYGGAQMRIHLSRALAAEGSIDYYQVDFGPDSRVKVYPVQASLLAYLTPQYRVSPYLLGGAGWYFTRLEGPGFHTTKDQFGAHAGAGLEAKLNEAISIDGSYRYIWLERLATHDASVIDKKYRGSGSMVTIGLNFYF